jgi:NADH-quinone oxidoreductase subunit G
VLRVLGNLLDLPGFDANSSEEVRDALRALVERNARPLPVQPAGLAIPDGPVTVTDVALYQSDAIVRRSAPLQRTREARNFRRVYGEAGVSA